MYCTPPETRTAKKMHQCMNCGEMIEVGEQYMRWVSFDDTATTNKMHQECLEALQDDSSGFFEYSPYSGERPERKENA